MVMKRFYYLSLSIVFLFILSGWSGPYLEAGGEVFVAGVQVFFGYVLIAGIGTAIFIFVNKQNFKEPEPPPEFWSLVLRLFKLFWMIPTVFFIIILALLFAFEIMGPIFI